MEGQSFRIVCLQMFTLTDTILEGQRLAVLRIWDEEEYFFKGYLKFVIDLAQEAF